MSDDKKEMSAPKKLGLAVLIWVLVMFAAERFYQNSQDNERYEAAVEEGNRLNERLRDIGGSTYDADTSYTERQTLASSLPEFKYQKLNFYKDVSGYVKFLGEVVNPTGNEYQMASFQAAAYDQQGRLIDTSPVIVSSIPAYGTKSFDTLFLNASASQIANCRIQVENAH